MLLGIQLCSHVKKQCEECYDGEEAELYHMLRELIMM
jgi:hypothetical protein